MANVELSYNPYLVKTTIKIDGKIPGNRSKLHIPLGARLQEWIEEFPVLLSKECDGKLNIEFTGTKVDFEDVKTAFSESTVPHNLSLTHIKDDVDDAEKTIDKIFSDIQSGPIDDLKTSIIKETFSKAKSSEFEVNVVATMSSGKSTLINALLGRKLMPAKNEATTATIVKIKDVDGMKNYSAVAYDKDHNFIKRYEKVTLKDMQALNDNGDVYQIDIEGDIKFVSSDGMSLVLVDTPGPNNSRDIHHQEMTFKMLEDSDKSLVLFVMNGRQLGINDEKVFLDFICTNMKKGGKKTRDRYIFAVNQLDAFKPNPDDDGEDCIEKALTSVRDCLNERGIKDANIFPVSAGVALEKRIDDEDEELLHPFYKKAKKYEAMRFNEYNQFSHQPLSVREILAKEMEELDAEDKVEYYSGIRNIEEAIRLYINKYARTTKVCDLVLSFRTKLSELATMAKLEDSIRRDADFKKRLALEIKKAKSLISDSKTTKLFTDEVERSNYTAETEKDIVKAISDAKRNFRELVSGKDHQVPVATAKSQTRTIENQFNQSAAQINVRVSGIIQNSFKKTLSTVISKYIGHLNGLGITPQSMDLSSYSGVTVLLPDMNQSLKNNTSTKDESYIKQVEETVTIEGNKGTYGSWGVAAGASFGAALGSALPGLGTLAGALIGGIAGLFGGRASGHDDYYETRYVPKKVEKFVDYVDMQEVASSASHEFDKLMDQLETKALHYIRVENDKLKKNIKDKIKEIDALLLRKLDDLQGLENSDKQTSETIAKKENNRKWLIDIQQRVDNLIEF